jgi:hypothetical protein
LLTMYQKLLIQKEQRLREFMTRCEEGGADYQRIVSSRSWRLVMGLHRLKYRLRHLF